MLKDGDTDALGDNEGESDLEREGDTLALGDKDSLSEGLND